MIDHAAALRWIRDDNPVICARLWIACRVCAPRVRNIGHRTRTFGLWIAYGGLKEVRDQADGHGGSLLGRARLYEHEDELQHVRWHRHHANVRKP